MDITITLFGYIKSFFFLYLISCFSIYKAIVDGNYKIRINIEFNYDS